MRHAQPTITLLAMTLLTSVALGQGVYRVDPIAANSYHGPAGDANGDSIQDHLIRGSSGLGLISGADHQWIRDIGSPYLFAITSVGDIDRDGCDDFVYQETYYSEYHGVDEFWDYFESGRDGSLWQIFYDYARSRENPTSDYRHVGDLNGDFFPDIIRTQYWDGRNGRRPVIEFLYGTDFPPGSPFVQPQRAFVYHPLEGYVQGYPAGDTNMDGHDDVAVAVDRYRGWTSVALFSGKYPYELMRELAGVDNRNGDEFGTAVLRIADLDDDGYNEFAIGAPGFMPPGSTLHHGRLYIFSGATGEVVQKRTGEANQRFGSSLGKIGDINGDSRAEIAVGSDAGPIDVLDGRTMETIYSYESLANLTVLKAGDLDHDGMDEFAVVSPTAIQYLRGGATAITLRASMIHENGTGRLRLTGGTPFSLVNFYLGRDGFGRVYMPGLGVHLVIQEPVLVATEVTDSHGEAEVLVPTPSGYANSEVVLQAAQHGKTSNWIQRVVRP